MTLAQHSLVIKPRESRFRDGCQRSLTKQVLRQKVEDSDAFHCVLQSEDPRKSPTPTLIFALATVPPVMARGTQAIPRWRPSTLTAIIQEHDDESDKPWLPDVRFIIRLLIVARTVAAIQSNISDCDETFNYWEPLHLLSHPPRPLGSSQSPFQTWEYVPHFAIRSWSYLLQYVPVSKAVQWIPGKDKAASFYATRIVLGICSSVCEAHLVQSIAEHVSVRAARYALLMLLFSAGMFASATALLPSSFAMYATTLASAYALRPAVEGAETFVINVSLPGASIRQRAQMATIIFACGALIAWPFALVISLPFMFEQLFMPSGLLVPVKRYAELVRLRLVQWIKCVALAAIVVGLPILALDSIAYKRFVFVPLQIIKYNILSAKRGAGPTLYGTEPWYYYLLNLALNLGPALPLALASLPLAAITAMYYPTTISSEKQAKTVQADAKKEGNRHLSTSPFTLLVIRMLPAYIWLALLSTQAHKEERFVYPAYPMLYFNASISLLCVRIWIKGSASTASRASARRNTARIVTSAAVVLCAAFSVSRIVHTTSSYRAPIAVLEHLKNHELPRVVAHSYPERQSAIVRTRLAAGQAPVLSLAEIEKLSWRDDRKNDPFVDISALVTLANERGQDEALRLCYGKEWHRFPTTYLVPDGVAVDFIKSEFTGILPKHFVRQDVNGGQSVDRSSSTLSLLQSYVWPWRFATSALRTGTYNDMNREEADQYVDISSCDYLVDVASNAVSKYEPDFVNDKRKWSRVFCLPFLDATNSRAARNATPWTKVRATIDRTLWLPSPLRGTTNHFSQYCLLRTTRTSSLANVKLPKGGV